MWSKVKSVIGSILFVIAVFLMIAPITVYQMVTKLIQ